jgi:hypothetical protein
MKPKAVNPMQILARKASEKERFLGYILSKYAEENGLEVSAVLSKLSCPPENLAILSLCRVPRAAEQFFGLDVRSIGEYADCDASELANLLREYSTLEAMRKVSENALLDRSMLMAARDKKGSVKKANESDEAD